ncbi:ribonuclease 2-like [Typha latifolia]|uniref:ribonuclease 2-like n=1 Tax=Typha latifolia TaxID=4733 RepID=UPI003C2CFEFA
MEKASTSLRSLLRLSLVLFVSFLWLPFFLSSSEASSQREFDYFVLALQWPGTICQNTHHCCSSNGCCRSDSLPWFTIHGLWENYDDGSWPACCSHSNFDMKKISSLLPTLEKYWPSLYCSSSSLCYGGKGPFWAHEWEKHGTCSYPVIQDEYSYFSTTLDLYFKYNITVISLYFIDKMCSSRLCYFSCSPGFSLNPIKDILFLFTQMDVKYIIAQWNCISLNDKIDSILCSAGIEAANGERYPLGDIVATIKKSFGATPLLACKHGSLQELKLCFYKDFKPRDCISGSNMVNGTVNSRSSCPRYVSLPTYMPLVLGDISGSTSGPANHEMFRSLTAS